MKKDERLNDTLESVEFRRDPMKKCPLPLLLFPWGFY